MALTIEIKVMPSSGRQNLVLEASGLLKCFLKSPPERGKANDELCKFLAKLLGFTRDCVRIVQGRTSRKKLIRIEASITIEQLYEKLGFSKQMSLM